MAAKEFVKKRMNRAKSPTVLTAERNAFGTRLCQRVECSRCYRVDYVARRTKSANLALCRSCAEKHLGIYEEGRTIAEPQVKRFCQKCAQSFLVNRSTAERKADLMCLDCLRGFDVWRTKRISPAQRHRVELIKKAGSNTIIRKIADDAN
jgi:hypothetical protein